MHICLWIFILPKLINNSTTNMVFNDLWCNFKLIYRNYIYRRTDQPTFDNWFMNAYEFVIYFLISAIYTSNTCFFMYLWTFCVRFNVANAQLYNLRRCLFQTKQTHSLGKKWIKIITDKGTWQFEWMSFNIYFVISGSTLGYTSITTVDITTRQKSIFRLLTNGDCKVILGSCNELN